MPQEPSWWNAAVASTQVALTPAVARYTQAAAEEPPTLFDAAADDAAQRSVDRLVAAVIASRPYRDQRKGAVRSAVTDAQVSSLLSTLLATPAGRIPSAQACIALGVPTVALRGAVPHVQRLLNVEGYGVLTVDADGSTLVLDRDLLRDQFEVDA